MNSWDNLWLHTWAVSTEYVIVQFHHFKPLSVCRRYNSAFNKGFNCAGDAGMLLFSLPYQRVYLIFRCGRATWPPFLSLAVSCSFLSLSPFLNLNHPLSSVNIPKEDNLILRKVLANDFWYWKVLQRQICYRYVFVPTRAQVIVKLLFRLVVRNLPESFQVLYSPPYCGNALHFNAAARSLCGFDSSFEWSRKEPDRRRRADNWPSLSSTGASHLEPSESRPFSSSCNWTFGTESRFNGLVVTAVMTNFERQSTLLRRRLLSHCLVAKMTL